MIVSKSANTYVQVYRAANSVEAHVLRGTLENHGIPVRIVGEGLSSGIGQLPLEVVEVVVQVPSGYRDLARQLVEDYERRRQEPAGNSSDWSCARCDERCPDEFAVCWNCGAARPTG